MSGAVSNWTTLKVLDWTAGRFGAAGLQSPRLEAQILLAHVLGCTRVQLYTGFDRPMEEPELAAYRGLIKRRLAGEPMAYLIGEQEFWAMPFTVDPSVLVSRPSSSVSCGCGSTGIPRPSSSTVIEPSLLMVTRIFLAWPAMASSIELSTTS